MDGGRASQAKSPAEAGREEQFNGKATRVLVEEQRAWLHLSALSLSLDLAGDLPGVFPRHQSLFQFVKTTLCEPTQLPHIKLRACYSAAS